jgi:hypothetical protein
MAAAEQSQLKRHGQVESIQSRVESRLKSLPRLEVSFGMACMHFLQCFVLSYSHIEICPN